MTPVLEQNRLLIVDDDEMVRIILRDTLVDEGFTIIEASDGTEALTKIRECTPDLILLDGMMPVMDGYAFLARIHEFEDLERLPVVMLTGLDDVESIQRAYRLGATDFITKPINWAILPHRLHYILRATRNLGELTRNRAALEDAQRVARLANFEIDAGLRNWRISNNMLDILGMHDTVAENAFSVENLCAIATEEDRGGLRAAFQRLRDERQIIHMDFRCVVNGCERILNLHAYPFENGNDAIPCIRGSIQDISEFRRIERQVHYLSNYDALTGLPNRALFCEVIGQAIQQSERYGDSLAVIFVGINHLKLINETLGIQFGDALLIQFADRLRQAVRNSDYVACATVNDETVTTTLSRLGGDEFTILLNHLQEMGDVLKVVRRILQDQKTPFQLGDQEVYVKLNIGIVTYPQDGDTSDLLISHGEFALNLARQDGDSNYRFYSSELNASACKQLSLESRLWRALEQQEFMLYYQPQVDMFTGQLVGMEALLRWHNPELGMISPAQFIPVAEESGLIGALGAWVLNTACLQKAAWEEEGLPAIPVAVNVSVVQLRHKNFLNNVRQALIMSGLRPESLELELTETVLGEPVKVLPALHTLKELGITLAIDDFGTGYSSLSYLKRLPMDILKIDRSFVEEAPHKPDDAAIVRAIHGVAEAMNLRVIAEGVETEAQVEFLKRLGCRVAQGFFYSKPLPVEEMEKLLRQH